MQSLRHDWQEFTKVFPFRKSSTKYASRDLLFASSNLVSVTVLTIRPLPLARSLPPRPRPYLWWP
jgi:hypothetical protein